MKIYYCASYKTAAYKNKAYEVSDKESISNSELLLKEALRRESYDYTIERNPHGKPYLKDAPNIFFSITHTKNLWFCAFDDNEIGIDAEFYGRKNFSVLKLSKRFFTETEHRFISDISDFEQQRRVFLRLWTMKEAALKLRGSGISGRLDSIELVYNEKISSKYEDLNFYTLKIVDNPDLCITVCTKKADFSNSDIYGELPMIDNIKIESL